LNRKKDENDRPMVLIVDTQKDDIESTLAYAYSGNREMPFSFKTVSTIDSAIKELKRRSYSLVLASEFLPEDIVGVNIDELYMRDDLLRLLEFLLGTNNPTRVCVISALFIVDTQEELYGSYPSVVGMFGRYYDERKLMAIRKIIRQYVPAPEKTKRTGEAV